MPRENTADRGVVDHVSPAWLLAHHVRAGLKEQQRVCLVLRMRPPIVGASPGASTSVIRSALGAGASNRVGPVPRR